MLLAWSALAVFAGSLAYLMYFYGVRLAQTVPAGGDPLRAVATNAGLFVAFAAHHSLLARDGVKDRLRPLIGARRERALYVWTASLLLVLVCTLWQPIPGTVYRLDGWLAAPGYGIQASGLALIAWAVRHLGVRELSGMAPLLEPPATAGEPLVAGGPYLWVRHPIYFGWILAVGGAPFMTAGRLCFAALSTAYLLIAVHWEERALGRRYGRAYARYTDRVRWRVVPGVY